MHTHTHTHGAIRAPLVSLSLRPPLQVSALPTSCISSPGFTSHTHNVSSKQRGDLVSRVCISTALSLTTFQRKQNRFALSPHSSFFADQPDDVTLPSQLPPKLCTVKHYAFLHPPKKRKEKETKRTVTTRSVDTYLDTRVFFWGVRG